VVRGEVAQAMYTHVSKCKNDKIKGERKNNKILDGFLSILLFFIKN
jgi:hypothetical protein